MKTATLTASLLTTILLATPASFLRAQTRAVELDLRDEAVFAPEFFPGLHDRTEAEVLLTGLMQLYPQRIVSSPPAADLPEAEPPVVRDLSPRGVYVRVKDLETALPVIREQLEEQPVIILDFRFLSADLGSILTLGSYLTGKSRLQLQIVGSYPAPEEHLRDSILTVEGAGLRQEDQAVFTLSNHETQGPLEALLEQLKQTGEIISVGTASAGRTGSFEALEQFPDFYIVQGEVRAIGADSLLATGFVPRVEVNVTPDDDLLGYTSLREGVSIEELVEARVAKPRLDEARLRNGGPPFPADERDQDQEDELPMDEILQRTVNIVKALQALGKIAG